MQPFNFQIYLLTLLNLFEKPILIRNHLQCLHRIGYNNEKNLPVDVQS